jgi:hypothetical protein
VVDDCPRHISPDPSKATHSIYIPQHNLRIPLRLKGVLSYFEMRFPTVVELESYPWIELTSRNGIHMIGAWKKPKTILCMKKVSFVPFMTEISVQS